MRVGTHRVRPRSTAGELQEVIDQAMTDDIDLASITLPDDTTNLRQPDHDDPPRSSSPEEDSPDGQPSWWITRISAGGGRVLSVGGRRSCRRARARLRVRLACRARRVHTPACWAKARCPPRKPPTE